jgi:hypothetical protein
MIRIESDDVRQALAWMCGRTDGASVCALALRSEGLPIGTQ